MKVSDLRNDKNALYTSLSRDLAEFEKNFLLISAGTFTISVTFIKDIVTLVSAEGLWWLFAGWFFVGAATGIIMITFLYSADLANQLLKKADKFLVDNSLLDKDEDVIDILAISYKADVSQIYNTGKNRLRNLRYTAVGAFILGIFCMALFIGINILKENQIQIKEQKVNKEVILKLKHSNIISNDTAFIFTEEVSDSPVTKIVRAPYTVNKYKRQKCNCCNESHINDSLISLIKTMIKNK